MKIIKLLEARRNPALNTKQEFQQFIDGVFQKNGGSDNLFFSFQNLKKNWEPIRKAHGKLLVGFMRIQRIILKPGVKK